MSSYNGSTSKQICSCTYVHCCHTWTRNFFFANSKNCNAAPEFLIVGMRQHWGQDDFLFRLNTKIHCIQDGGLSTRIRRRESNFKIQLSIIINQNTSQFMFSHKIEMSICLKKSLYINQSLLQQEVNNYTLWLMTHLFHITEHTQFCHTLLNFKVESSICQDSQHA